MKLGRFGGVGRRGRSAVHAVSTGILVLVMCTGCASSSPRLTTPVQAVEVASLHAAGVPPPAPPVPEPAAPLPRTVPAPEPVPSVIVAPDDEPRSSVHVVRRGDTLYSIARAHGSSVDELTRLNGLDDPSNLEIGQVLTLPGRPNAGEWDWPVPGGWLLSTFGAARRTHRHAGVDIGGHRGQPVLAARDGRVVYSDESMRGYGKTVILDHGDGLTTLYAHNSALLVRPGDVVRRGQPVARVGRSGNASGEHCHFEVRRDDVPVDPLAFLRVPGGMP